VAELNPNTDLAGPVERVARNNLPWGVIPVAALTAWEERDSAEARTLSVGARALGAMLSAAAKRG